MLLHVNIFKTSCESCRVLSVSSLNPVNLLPGATLMGLCINNIHIQYTITYMNYLHVHHAHIYIYTHNYIYIYVCVCVIHTQIWISKAKMQHPLPQNPVPLAAPRSWPKRKLRRWTCQTSPVVELTFFKTSKMG